MDDTEDLVLRAREGTSHHLEELCHREGDRSRWGGEQALYCENPRATRQLCGSLPWAGMLWIVSRLKVEVLRIALNMD